MYMYLSVYVFYMMSLTIFEEWKGMQYIAPPSIPHFLLILKGFVVDIMRNFSLLLVSKHRQSVGLAFYNNLRGSFFRNDTKQMMQKNEISIYLVNQTATISSFLQNIASSSSLSCDGQKIKHHRTDQMP
jgi:hypothetical protein